jgi:hypothetical protein
VRLKLTAAVCVAIAALLPASVSATTVKLGASGSNPNSGTSCGVFAPCTSPFTIVQRALPDESIALAAPADGTVTSWSFSGQGAPKLRVLRPIGESVIADGTSLPATNVGGPNPTSLPIKAGEVIGLDVVSGTRVEGNPERQGAIRTTFEPAVPEDGLADAPNFSAKSESFFNATVTLAPSVAGLTPTSGKATGGEAVKIVGSNLDGATGVTFGSKAAVFTIDSANQITATAPAVPASTVDVRVIGPGGTSPINDGDRYTFTGASGAPGSTGPGLISPLTAGQPKLTALAQTASKWRRGHQQAKISRAPIGTTFSFNLSKPATVKLAFTQKATGRKVRGACKAPNPSNASKRKCTRTILAGTLSLPAHAGLNKLRFQGLLPNGKSLKLGSYNVALTARDSGGLQSVAHSLSFSIVG